jgi:hypothetical protein
VDTIELPVFTRVFRLRRRLYRIYDVELPAPVSLLQLAVFAVAAAAAFAALRGAGIDLTPGSAWAYVVPPVVLAWLAGRALADDRSTAEWMAAHARHLVEPRTLVALEPRRGGRSTAVAVVVWGRRVRRGGRR